AALAEFAHVEQSAPLPPEIARRWSDALEAHAIRALDGFDLDDVGAHRREIMGDEWPGPKGGEVDDTQAGQGARCIIPFLTKEGARGRFATFFSKTSPGPSLVRRGTFNGSFGTFARLPRVGIGLPRAGVLAQFWRPR